MTIEEVIASTKPFVAAHCLETEKHLSQATRATFCLKWPQDIIENCLRDHKN